MTKIDKRVKYILTVDVETAGSIGSPLIYDIGYVITDKRGKIYEERSFIIKEIFENKALMSSAYYGEKVPQYLEEIKQGKRTVVPFMEMRKDFLELSEKYNVKVLSAYNLAFDNKALKNTMLYITQDEKAKFLNEQFIGVEMLCIWCLACETLYTQKIFSTLAVRHNWMSKAGNYRTSAEIGYRFITGNYDFIEEHTGLEDVKIEVQIMAYAFRQNKKRTKGIFHNPWRIPNQKKYK